MISQGGTVVRNPPASWGDSRDAGSIPGSGRSPGVGDDNSAPMFLPGKFHGQRNLAGYRLWGCKEWDTTEHACMLNTYTYL